MGESMRNIYYEEYPYKEYRAVRPARSNVWHVEVRGRLEEDDPWTTKVVYYTFKKGWKSPKEFGIKQEALAYIQKLKVLDRDKGECTPWQ
jgi:hypothetical protein